MAEGSRANQSLVNVRRPIHPVIEITRASKHYGRCANWRQVLNKLNLTIFSGDIYALLGSNGCGKSTVLHVILGVTNLDEGDVKVFGFGPGFPASGIPGIRVGYTPQSHGLYPEFTINETLHYYGILLKLNKEYISERVDYLRNLLSLPTDNQLIRQCNECSKRQISFAVALLHEPEVLILDEPCAGIDPVLKRSMWEHMRKLANQDIAVLVTTQNCEEAKLASVVGFMRNGNILLQGNPQELLKHYKEKQLETLYRRVYGLNLGLLGDTGSIDENPIILLEPIRISTSEGFFFDEEEDDLGPEELGLEYNPEELKDRSRVKRYFTPLCFDYRRICVLILRDFVRCLRSYTWLLVFLFLPTVILILCCLTIGTTPTSLELGVVNLEASEDACISSPQSFFSCQFLLFIDNNTITRTAFESEEDARRAAIKSEVSAILVIQPEYSVYLEEMFTEFVLEQKTKHPDFPLILYLDLTSKIIAQTIEISVRKALLDFLDTVIAQQEEIEGFMFDNPLRLGAPLFGNNETSDMHYMAPALTINFIYHISAFVVALTLITNRLSKITLRDYLAGVRVTEKILAQVIVYGVFVFLEAILLFLIMILVFHIPFRAPLMVFVITLLQIWCGISFGTVISALCNSEVAAGLCVFFSMAVSLIFCGILWPGNGFPYTVKKLVQFLPQTEAINSIRTVLLRGIFARVELGIVIPVMWTILFVLIYSFINKEI